MNLLSNWLKRLAEVTPKPVIFNVIDPSSPKKEVRPLELTVIPPTKADPRSIVSLYWKESSQKVYEKAFDTADQAAEVYTLYKSDLEMVQNLSKEQKVEEASLALDKVLTRGAAETDPLINGDPTPITTTMASKKEAKVTMQNIFFSTPEEAIKYQEEMKKLQGPSSETPPTEGLPEDTKTPPELVTPSVSYEDAEKQKAEEEKNLSKRIEDEVDEQIKSSLEKKRATKFTPADETLVTALRGVGRTWEEVKDYLVKGLHYDKNDVMNFVDYMKGQEDKANGVEPEVKPEAPEVAEPLVEQELPAEEIPVEIPEVKSVQKTALDPLEEAPELPPFVPDAPVKEEAPAVNSMELAEGDWVNVLSNPETKTEGMSGTFVSTFSRKGVDYAIIELENGEFAEVHQHLVTKASLKKSADEPVKTTPKTYKVTPPHVEQGDAEPATPAIEETYKAIKTSEHNLAAIKNLVDQAQSAFAAEKKRIEEQGGRIQNETALTDKIERLAALVEATQSRLVSLGDELVYLKQETKEIPVKWSDREKLTHIYKKFPETEQYIEKALRGAQKLATSESVRELIFFPKKKLSKLDKSASPLDTLTMVYDDLMNALKGILAISK